MRLAGIRRTVILVLLSAVSIPAAAHAGAWTSDSSVGCRVWNPHPQPNETIQWSGACTNGLAQGRGAAQWFKDGVPLETDEGEWLAGRQTGYGSQVWSAGRYEGELLDGEPHGRGVLILQRLRYEGDFRNGKADGTGTLFKGSESFRGVWTNGCFREGTRKASFGVPLSACP
jgi:hypothetical protein